jgi:hypothetical protein
MPVYDIQGRKVGTVAYAHPGLDESAPAWSLKPGAGVNEEHVPAEVRDMIPRDLEPPEIRQRMLQLGFLKISPGPMLPERFVLPEQIDFVSDEGVRLTVSRDRLPIF